MAETSLICEKEHRTMIDWLPLFVYLHIYLTLGYSSVCVLCHFSCTWLFATPWTGLPGSSVHGILQARILERVAMPFSDLPNPGVKPVSLFSLALSGTFCTSSTIAVLNLICDNWNFLWALDIFKRLLTYVCVCVCVCVCLYEREKSPRHPDKHPVIDQTLLTLLSSFSTRPGFCVHLCTSSILLGLEFWPIPHPPWSPDHIWSPWSALTRHPVRSG